MQSLSQLESHLCRLDGRGYKAYKAIAGAYDAGLWELCVDHVQGDPFAEPSRVRAVVAPEIAGLPLWTRQTQQRRRATADFINRQFHRALARESRPRGSGKSGELRILKPGQQVLTRTSLVVGVDGTVEARFRVGLPAHGRRIAGRQAAQLFANDLSNAVRRGLLFESLDASLLRQHVESVEDACALRQQLVDKSLVAFVADGAVLPRLSGVDDRPLDSAQLVRFESPESLRVRLDTPNSGSVEGMGLPTGVTLIVGGGYHGKSTLLRAIERGVYDHVPGDGREQVVTVPGAVKIRAEDGRRVAGTDIANFISELPDGQDTRQFWSDNASGSTSQAAAISEALEVGAVCLLLDEDTSATNFMIRDARMQKLIQAEFEPITPYIDRVRALSDDLGVSTVVVVGGAGDYFEVADTVVALRNYQAAEVTGQARDIVKRLPSQRRPEGGAWREPSHRIVDPDSIDPGRGRKEVSIRTHAQDRLSFGTEEVDLGAVEQIVELGQTQAMAQALVWARAQVFDGRRSVREALDQLMAVMEERGLEALQQRPNGDHASYRIFELAAFLNRVRSLRLV